MGVYVVTIIDVLRFKRIIYLEAKNAATLDLGLNATLGMAGCEIIKVEEYVPVEY